MMYMYGTVYTIDDFPRLYTQPQVTPQSINPGYGLALEYSTNIRNRDLFLFNSKVVFSVLINAL